MSELTLLILRIAFLLLLWLFVFGVVYALRSDLFGQRTRKLQADASNQFPTNSPAASPAPAPAHAPAAAAGSAAAAAATTASMQRPPVSQLPSGANAATSSRPKATIITAGRLVITSGPRQGTEVPLGREPITIGRSGDSGLIVRDDYTSTHHARLLLWNDEWMIQDLDSTNGTFLENQRVSVPTQVPLNAPIKIGSTTFELRR